MDAIQRFEYHRRRRHVREKSNNEKKQGQAHPRPRGGSRYPLPRDENPRGGRSIRLSAIRSRRWTLAFFVFSSASSSSSFSSRFTCNHAIQRSSTNTCPHSAIVFRVPTFDPPRLVPASCRSGIYYPVARPRHVLLPLVRTMLPPRWAIDFTVYSIDEPDDTVHPVHGHSAIIAHPVNSRCRDSRPDNARRIDVARLYRTASSARASRFLLRVLVVQKRYSNSENQRTTAQSETIKGFRALTHLDR